MRYVGWIAKFVLFLLLLGFALKNTDAVDRAISKTPVGIVGWQGGLSINVG